MSGIFLTLLATVNRAITALKGSVSGQPMSDVGFGG